MFEVAVACNRSGGLVYYVRRSVALVSAARSRHKNDTNTLKFTTVIMCCARYTNYLFRSVVKYTCGLASRESKSIDTIACDRNPGSIFIDNCSIMTTVCGLSGNMCFINNNNFDREQPVSCSLVNQFYILLVRLILNKQTCLEQLSGMFPSTLYHLLVC